MPAERYYAPLPLETGATLSLQGQEHHHLAHVMRGRCGDEVEIVNGQGQLASAAIESVGKDRSSLSILNVVTEQQPVKSLILAQGIPRLNRLEFIVEKGTELGMTEIRLFPAARGEKKELSPNQMDRLQAIIISAMKQCGRLFLPKLTVIPPIKRWEAESSQCCLFGDVRPSASLMTDMMAQSAPFDGIIVCIGPESGLTNEEVVLLEEKNYRGVKIHSNILRTETAAITALVLASLNY